MIRILVAVGLLGLVPTGCGRTATPDSDRAPRVTRFWRLEYTGAHRVAGLLRQHLEIDGLEVGAFASQRCVIATGSKGVVDRAWEIVKQLDIPVYACGFPTYAWQVKFRSARDLLPIVRDATAYLDRVHALDDLESWRPAPLVLHDRVHNRILLFGDYNHGRILSAVLREIDVE